MSGTFIVVGQVGMTFGAGRVGGDGRWLESWKDIPELSVRDEGISREWIALDRSASLAVASKENLGAAA